MKMNINFSAWIDSGYARANHEYFKNKFVCLYSHVQETIYLLISSWVQRYTLRLYSFILLLKWNSEMSIIIMTTKMVFRYSVNYTNTHEKRSQKKNKDKTVNLKNFRDSLISSHNVLRDLLKFKCVSTKQNRPWCYLVKKKGKRKKMQDKNN